MDSYRSHQDTVALRDIAYVIRFGHFPSEDEAGAAGPSTEAATTPTPSSPSPTCPPSSSPTPSPPCPQSEDRRAPSEDGNPFNEDGNPFNEDGNPFNEDGNPFNEDENPFNEDGNPFAEDLDSPVDDTNPFAEDLNHSNTEQDSTHGSQGTPQDTPPQPLPHATPQASPGRPLQQLDVKSVSRRLVKEAVTEAFNVTHLDLRCLMEEVGRNKETPSVQLLLEELRTEGLGLEPTTGSCSPPLVFLKASVGEESSFTAFTSTSATRSTQETLTMEVSNMYTEMLLLQVWKASVPVVVETSSGPMMDVLARLIKHAKEKTGPIPYPRANGVQSSEQKNLLAGEARQEEHQRDQVDHSDDTPVINVSLWEKNKGQQSGNVLNEVSNTTTSSAGSDTNDQSMEGEVEMPRKGSGDSLASSGEGDGEAILPNGEEKSDSHPTSDEISITQELSVQQVMTSTPRGRSASFQATDLSASTNSDASRTSQKSKNLKGSFSKFSTSNIKASLRASIRKKKQNESTDNVGQQSKQYDTASMISGYSDTSSHNPNDDEMMRVSPRGGGRDSSSPEKDDQDMVVIGSGKGKLNREKSRSTISITSFSRMNRSLRLSSHKASQVFRRIGSKKGKISHSETSTPQLARHNPQPMFTSDNTSLTKVQTDLNIDQTDATPNPDHPSNHYDTPVAHPPKEDNVDVIPYSMKSFRSLFSSPRALRTFSSPRAKGTSEQRESEKAGYDAEATQNSPASLPAPLNPEDIHNYLSSLGKANFKAELLAYVSIPIKSLVGTWKKEGWLPMTVVEKERSSSQKKKKGAKPTASASREVVSNRAGCRFHMRLTLPFPETELTSTSYDTYNATLSKLVRARLHNLGSVAGYRGEVGPVGDVLLQQLIFFSRVTEPHRSLAKFLILVEVQPGDPGLLLPLLRAIKTHLEAGIYLTAQKRQLSGALVIWVKKVLSDEFERLHSSFPMREGLLELARLENYLRCFNTVENCYELRVLFERELAPQGQTAITDLLQGVLIKHAEIWVEALNKEKLQQGRSEANSEAGSDADDSGSWEWTVWQESLRRASLLTQPILDFLTISFHTYQPIFMLELSVDYMYLVMPKMLMAAAHLLNPLYKFDVDGVAHQVPPKTIATAAHAIWLLCTNLSNINKIGIDSRLPQHLILQAYCDAFSVILHHWLALSKHLALQEFHKDIQEDLLVAVDEAEGYSQSAFGVADLMKAMMVRMCDLRWPGGMAPRGTTLVKMGQQMMEMAAQYAEQVTHTYIAIAAQTDNIPTEVCVVVRNVEHVCNEVRKHLLQMAQMAGRQQEVALQLEDRTKHLQEHVDNTAEALLRQCLPGLERTLTKGVQTGSSAFVLKELEAAMEPVKDRLFFAEPLLHQLWYRLFGHAEELKGFYVQNELREELRRLGTVLDDTYNFLTDQEGVNLSLLDEVIQKYEAVQAELRLLGATSAELVSQFYQMRYSEQQREESNSGRVLVFNAVFTETGLRVHVVQAPGVAVGSSLVKARLEPFQWFPGAEPQKTHQAKGNPAVFDEVLEFPGVKKDHPGGGGMLTLQVRTPRLLSSSIVHDETILPLAQVSKVPAADVFSAAHVRLPLTRPWDFNSYKPLQALMTRPLDRTAVDFLKSLSERWKTSDNSDQIQDNQILRATFARAGSMRSIKAASRKPSHRGALVK